MYSQGFHQKRTNANMTLQQAAEECRWLVNLKHDTTVSTRNKICNQHHSRTAVLKIIYLHKKRNLHPLAGIVMAGILQGNVHAKHTTVANAIGRHTEGFCTLPVHKTTNKRPHNKRRLKRKNTQTVW